MVSMIYFASFVFRLIQLCVYGNRFYFTIVNLIQLEKLTERYIYIYIHIR